MNWILLPADCEIQIGNSIVIHDKWDKETVGEESSSAMEIAFEENWWLTLIISALLTWGVGLLPPILIRFMFVRKPLSKKAAIVLACVFWFFNLVFFIAIGSQSKTHYALFLVAVASYYILRAGHKKSANNRNPNKTRLDMDNEKKGDGTSYNSG